MHDLHRLIQNLPKDERDAADTLADHVEELYRYTSRFAAAVVLFDVSVGETIRSPDQRIQDAIREWAFMAGRDGAMTIYHFGAILKAINDNLPKSPALFQRLPRQKLGEANDLFRTSFPAVEKIRHAVGHEAEIHLTSNQVSANAFSGNYESKLLTVDSGESGFATGNIDGRFYMVTFKGQILRYELSATTHNTLHAIAKIMFEALSEACKVQGP